MSAHFVARCAPPLGEDANIVRGFFRVYTEICHFGHFSFHATTLRFTEISGAPVENTRPLAKSARRLARQVLSLVV
jgi:hypothetical protein